MMQLTNMCVYWTDPLSLVCYSRLCATATTTSRTLCAPTASSRLLSLSSSHLCMTRAWRSYNSSQVVMTNMCEDCRRWGTILCSAATHVCTHAAVHGCIIARCILGSHLLPWPSQRRGVRGKHTWHRHAFGLLRFDSK